MMSKKIRNDQITTKYVEQGFTRRNVDYIVEKINSYLIFNKIINTVNFGNNVYIILKFIQKPTQQK